MGFWTFVLWTVVISAIVKLVRSAMDNDRQARIAKVEAELKIRLVEKLKDPELVRRVIEAQLPKDGQAERSVEDYLAARTSAAAPDSTSQEPAKTPSVYVLVGLICFLIGVAFLVSVPVMDKEALVLPGAICSAVGLAFLTFATSQRQILRHTGALETE